MKTFPVGLSRGKRAQFAAVLTVALTACGPEEVSLVGASEPALHPPSSATTSRAAHIREVQAGAGAAYAIRSVGGVLHARHPAQGFDVDFGSSVGLRLPGDERLSLTTTGYGCEGGARPVAAAQPVSTGNRVEYARRGGASGELTEWYVHGPLGLEQGFTLDAPLGCGDRDVVVEMELGGTLSASAGGKGVVALRNARGWAVATYRDLYVEDARGRALLAELAVQGNFIRIRFKDVGAQYPIEIDPLVAVEQATLSASDAEGGENFGWRVAISGNAALIGALPSNPPNVVHAFSRAGGIWTEQSALNPSGGLLGTSALAMSGDTAVVAGNTAPGPTSYLSVAYVFVQTDGAWVEQAMLQPSNVNEDSQFGYSVDISGDTVVVGAPSDADNGEGTGAVYVFERTGTTWIQQAKLFASDSEATYADIMDTGSSFGRSVVISGDTILAGAPFHNGTGFDRGAVYSFVRNAGTWMQEAQIVASDAGNNERFGSNLALSGDRALIVGNVKYAYVLHRLAGSWMEEAILSPGVPQYGHVASVNILGDVLAIGDPGGPTGNVYLYAVVGDSWTQQQVLTNPDADGFGYSLASSEDTLLVGAPFTVGLELDVGSAYAYVLRSSNGSPCTAASECASTFCVDGVCCDAACDGGACDACSVALGAVVDGSCTPLSDVPCDDQDACTLVDTCQSGICVGKDQVTCSASEECRSEGTCDPVTGLCDSIPAADEAPCSLGVCQDGQCLPVDSTSTLVVGGGCACDMGRGDRPPAWTLALVLAVIIGGRVRLKRADHGSPRRYRTISSANGRGAARRTPARGAPFVENGLGGPWILSDERQPERQLRGWRAGDRARGPSGGPVHFCR